MRYRYDAFISYRHVPPDTKWAKWLHRALETYYTPRSLVAEGRRKRINRIFRDEEELAATSDLSAEIKEALHQSEYLIVVCSPRTPGSKWVNQEIAFFKELGRKDYVLALLIEGEPSESFPAAMYDFQRAKRSCSDDELNGWGEPEPLAADVRPKSDASPRAVRRAALLRCAAAILGCRFDDLMQRDQSRENRRLFVFSAVATILAAVLAGLSIFAFLQQGLAEARELQARQRLADSLVAQGNAQSASFSHRDARSSYKEAREVLSSLGSSTVEPDLGIWDSMRQSPLPLVVIPQELVVSDASFLSGERAIVANLDGVTIWNIRRQEMVRAVVSGEEVESLAVSADERLIATGGRRSQQAVIWELDSGREVLRVDVGQPVLEIAFSADSSRIATGGQQGTVTIWDIATGQPVSSVVHVPALESIALLSDGRLLTAGVPTRTSGSATDFIDVINAVDESTMELAKGALRKLQDGKEITATDFRIDLHSVLIWDLSPDSPVVRQGLPGKGNARDIAVSEAHDVAVVATGDEVSVWNIEKGNLVFVAPAGQQTSGVAISPDGGYALSVGNSGLLTVWDLDGRRPIRTIDVDEQPHRGVAYDTTGRLALLYGSGPLSIVDLESIPEFRRFGGDPTAIQDIAFSNDGRLAVTATDFRILVLWDTTTGQEIRAFQGNTKGIVRVAFLGDGRRIVTADLDGVLRLWDVETGTELTVFESERELGRVQSMAVSPSGSRVLTAHWNHRVVLWDVNLRRDIRRLDGYTIDPWSLTFIGEDRAAVGFGEGSVGIWDLDTGQEERTLFGASWPYSMSASVDGKLLVGDSSDDVFYWDASTGELLGRLVGHDDSVQAVAILTDKFALSTAEDGQMIVWDLEEKEPIRRIALESSDYTDRAVLTITPRQQILYGNPDDDKDFVQVWDVPLALEMSQKPRTDWPLDRWYTNRGHYQWAAETLAESDKVDPQLLALVEQGMSTLPRSTDGSGTPDDQSVAMVAELGYVGHLMGVVDRGRSAQPHEFVTQGETELESGNAIAALPYFERALRAREEWLQTIDDIDEETSAYLDLVLWEARLGRSDANLAMGNSEAALADIKCLTAVLPNDANFRLKLARTFEALDDLDSAQEQISIALELAPDEEATHVWLAEYYDRRGEHELALAAAESAVRLQASIDTLGLRASLLEKYGDLEAAIVDVTSALAIEQSAALYARRARLYRDSQALEEAIADLDKYEELDPANVWIPYYRADILVMMGDDIGAESALDGAVDEVRNHPQSIALRGLISIQRKEWNIAEGLLTQAIESMGTTDWRIYDYRGYSREQQGNFTGAISDLDAALEIAAGDPIAESNLHSSKGIVYLVELKEYEMALAEFDEAIRLQPDAAHAHHNRGATLRHLGRFEEALVALNNVFVLNGEKARTYFHRGMTFRSLDRHAEAKEDLTTYLDLTPDAEERDDIEQYLGN